METIYICSVCHVEADTREDINNHYNTKHGKKCNECDFAHADVLTFQRHMEFAHNKLPVNQCKICLEKFIGNDKFDRHLQFVHGTNHWDLNQGIKNARKLMKD